MIPIASSCPSILTRARAAVRSAGRALCAIAGAAAIAALAGCTSAQPPPRVAAAPPPPPPPSASHALRGEQPGFLRLPNTAPNTSPVRIGIILPFSNGSPATRKLASAMLNAAEMAMFDSGKPNLMIMTADEGGGGSEAAEAARKLLSEGAEVILGPLFADSVSAVAPVARDHGVPVIAFSTNRDVAGNGVYLLSFQPEDEVRRVISYAASQGHSNFAALVPRNPYGDHVVRAFRADVAAAGGQVTDVERFNPASGNVISQAHAIAASHPDAMLVGQGGQLLRSIGPTLAYEDLGDAQLKLLGTGVWDDPTILHEPSLVGGWFAAPQPDAADALDARYQSIFGGKPPRLTTLSYDAVSLVALLASGPPYHRFTEKALTDPNGFAGISGIFRFNDKGDCQRGLAILAVGPDGFNVVSPAPTSFEHLGS